MLNTLKNLSKRSRWLYLQYILYLLMIVASTLWAYVRINLVKSEEMREREAIEQYDSSEKT